MRIKVGNHNLTPDEYSRLLGRRIRETVHDSNGRTLEIDFATDEPLTDKQRAALLATLNSPFRLEQ